MTDETKIFTLGTYASNPPLLNEREAAWCDPVAKFNEAWETI